MRIGFVSTRFHGTDGVSLEAAKWAKVLEKDLDHECFWFAGKLDTPGHSSSLCPEAFFEHPSVISLQEKLFSDSNSCSNDLNDSVKNLEAEIFNSLEMSFKVKFLNSLFFFSICPTNSIEFYIL